MHADDGITYINSGTWIPMPDRGTTCSRRPTVHIRRGHGHYTPALRWNAAMGKPMPPLILAEAPAPAMDRVMGDDFFHP